MHALDDALLLCAFSFLSKNHVKKSCLLACKKWYQLLHKPAAWTHITIDCLYMQTVQALERQYKYVHYLEHLVLKNVSKKSSKHVLQWICSKCTNNTLQHLELDKFDVPEYFDMLLLANNASLKTLIVRNNFFSELSLKHVPANLEQLVWKCYVQDEIMQVGHLNNLKRLILSRKCAGHMQLFVQAISVAKHITICAEQLEITAPNMNRIQSLVLKRVKTDVMPIINCVPSSQLAYVQVNLSPDNIPSTIPAMKSIKISSLSCDFPFDKLPTHLAEHLHMKIVNAPVQEFSFVKSAYIQSTADIITRVIQLCPVLQAVRMSIEEMNASDALLLTLLNSKLKVIKFKHIMTGTCLAPIPNLPFNTYCKEFSIKPRIDFETKPQLWISEFLKHLPYLKKFTCAANVHNDDDNAVTTAILNGIASNKLQRLLFTKAAVTSSALMQLLANNTNLHTLRVEKFAENEDHNTLLQQVCQLKLQTLHLEILKQTAPVHVPFASIIQKSGSYLHNLHLFHCIIFGKQDLIHMSQQCPNLRTLTVTVDKEVEYDVYEQLVVYCIYLQDVKLIGLPRTIEKQLDKYVEHELQRDFKLSSKVSLCCIQ